MMRLLHPLIAVTAIAGLASAQPSSSAQFSAPRGPETRLFELRTYYASKGKGDALHARFRESAARLLEKHGITNLGYWVPADDSTNRVMLLLAYPNESARKASWAKLVIDPEWREIRRNSEAQGRLVERIEELMLNPTAECPVVAPIQSASPRSFELRTYSVKSSEQGFHKGIHDRYRERVVACWTSAPRTNGETLHVFLLVHPRPGVDQREPELTSSDPFRVSANMGRPKANGKQPDPAADGAVTTILVPTDYSPMR